MTIQNENLQTALEWLKTCPFEYAISSMSGGFVHIKLLIPMERLEDDNTSTQTAPLNPDG